MSMPGTLASIKLWLTVLCIRRHTVPLLRLRVPSVAFINFHRHLLQDAHEVKEHRALAGVWQEQLQADRKKEKSRASRSSTDFTPHVAGIQDSVELLQPRIGRMSLTGSSSLTSHAAEAHDHVHAEPHMQRVVEEEADGAEGMGAVQPPAAVPGQELGRQSKSVQGAGLARPAISVQASSAHAAPGSGLPKQQK